MAETREQWHVAWRTRTPEQWGEWVAEGAAACSQDRHILKGDEKSDPATIECIEANAAKAIAQVREAERAAFAPLEGIADVDLLRRAVNGARSRDKRKGLKHPRWVAVMDAFALGSTRARELCLRFDLNPDDEVKR